MYSEPLMYALSPCKGPVVFLMLFKIITTYCDIPFRCMYGKATLHSFKVWYIKCAYTLEWMFKI